MSDSPSSDIYQGIQIVASDPSLFLTVWKILRALSSTVGQHEITLKLHDTITKTIFPHHYPLVICNNNPLEIISLCKTALRKCKIEMSQMDSKVSGEIPDFKGIMILAFNHSVCVRAWKTLRGLSKNIINLHMAFGISDMDTKNLVILPHYYPLIILNDDPSEMIAVCKTTLQDCNIEMIDESTKKSEKKQPFIDEDSKFFSDASIQNAPNPKHECAGLWIKNYNAIFTTFLMGAFSTYGNLSYIQQAMISTLSERFVIFTIFSFL